MNRSHCEREQEVVRAVRSGRWPGAADEALRRHALSCPVCAEVALVAEFLRREEALESSVALPDPGLLWWKAEILAQREARERAAQPIAVAERAAAACGIIVLLAALFWEWPRLHAWALQLNVSWRLRDAMEAIAGLASGPSNTVFVMSAAACLALAAFVLYIVWAEE